MRKRVYLTVPNGDGLIHKLVAMRVLDLMRDPRHDVTVTMPTHRPFENNLHHCLNEFMDGGFDYWLTIDADNPPMGNPLDRVADDLDVVGFPTPVFNDSSPSGWPWYFNAYKWIADEGAFLPLPFNQGLQQVDAVGTGCVLFARRVFDNPVMRKAPFQRTFRSDGTVEMGNDLAFCRRATSLGFEIWCDYERPCHHFITTDLTSLITRVGEVTHGGTGPPESEHRPATERTR